MAEHGGPYRSIAKKVDSEEKSAGDKVREIFKQAEVVVVKEVVSLVVHAAHRLAGCHIASLIIAIGDYHSSSQDNLLSLRKISHPGLTRDMLAEVVRSLSKQGFSLAETGDRNIIVCWS